MANIFHRTNIPYAVVEKILLDIPSSKKRSEYSTDNKIVFEIDYVVVVVPKNGISFIYLVDILENQLGMSWWMIDYIFGQNGIKP